MTPDRIMEAYDVGTVVVGGLCILFYLLLGAGSLLNDRTEKRRRNEWLYGQGKQDEETEEEG